MNRLPRYANAAAAVCGLLTLWTATAIGRTTGPTSADAGKGAIVGTGTFTAFVENMDRSLAFYHDVFGMEVPPIPAAGERAHNRTNPQLFAMFDIPGARERHQSARVPGTRISLEVMEVQDVAHQTIPLRVQDPGTATLVLVVRDIDTTLTRVKQANVPVVAPRGKPVTLADGARAVLIRDVDKRFIELRQPSAVPAATAPATVEGETAFAALVEDPNNFFLTPFAPCDGCAPSLQVQSRQGATRPPATLPAQDVLDIQALVSRYGYVLDSGAEDGGAEGGRAYADLFTDDGVFASPQATVTGREALLEFASGHRPGQGPAYVRNFAMNMLVEPAPEGARGKVYAVVIAIGENAPGQQGAESSIFTGGHFEDVYAKTANGWRFKRRQFVPSEGGPTTNVGQPAPRA